MVYLLSIICGLFTSFAFKPFAFWPFAIIGLAGLFWLLNKNRFYQRVAISYLFGLSFLLTVQHWTSTYVGSFPWLILGLI